MNKFRKLKLRLSMRKHQSKVPTGLLPLSQIHTVVIFMDSADELTEPQKLTFRRKIGRDCNVDFLYATDVELRSESDLFISLSNTFEIFEEYAAVTSRARFKIGRHQLPKGTYDLVLSDTTPEPLPLLEAFDQIQKLLTTIQ